jgi:hypothetical protein
MPRPELCLVIHIPFLFVQRTIFTRQAEVKIMSYYKFGRETEPEIITADELYTKAIVYEYADVNKLHKHSTETIRHYIAKSMVFYLLRQMKHDVVTEFTIEGIGIGDVFDISTRTQYEIETDQYPKRFMKRLSKYQQAGIELIVIRTKPMPDDIKKIKDYIWPFLRPD